MPKRVIRLSEPEGGKGVRLPFDVLLRSLAKDPSVRTACIILSGTGTDVTPGLAEIKAAKGLILAYDPAEAGYPGMPECRKVPSPRGLLALKAGLQSLNDGLTALNSQLQETLVRHRTTANDLQNVLYSTNVATLSLDLDRNIRFFTPAARAIFRVIPTDVGRPLADLAAVARVLTVPLMPERSLQQLTPWKVKPQVLTGFRSCTASSPIAP